MVADEIIVLESAASRPARRGGRGPARGRAPAGRRLSAAELRARGVDEDFLARAPPVDGAPAAREAALGGGAGLARGPAPGQRPGSGQQREWSAGEMRREYGRGYELLAKMGYAGGGMVPLTAVKRQDRVALQDDEERAVDQSCALGKRRRRDRRALAATTLAPDPSDELVGQPPGQASSSGTTDDEMPSEPRLRRAILTSLRQCPGGRTQLEELVRKPRVRRALLASGSAAGGGGRQALRFVGRFVRDSVPSCRIGRSLPGWKELSAAGSAPGWERAARRGAAVVSLRSGPGGAGGALAEGAESEEVGSSSSSEASAGPAGAASTAAQRGALAAAAAWECHGCLRGFPSRRALSEHVLQPAPRALDARPRRPAEQLRPRPLRPRRAGGAGRRHGGERGRRGVLEVPRLRGPACRAAGSAEARAGSAGGAPGTRQAPGARRRAAAAGSSPAGAPVGRRPGRRWRRRHRAGARRRRARGVEARGAVAAAAGAPGARRRRTRLPGGREALPRLRRRRHVRVPAS
ncbi:unnamed protein product [Prorocentrum cordatum]|uniref:G-patch domain-containing protein n=2 Tax=Prorocentrum cordatum TaxID=2364126 RepID=A0ABN9QCT3_9DINO|nr:unnamed protein product [Polarella glacialis]